MTKATKTPEKKIAPKDNTMDEVVKFLQERIADGGATTDHLQVMLDSIKPPAQQDADFKDTGEGGTVRVL